ncbi:MAG: HAD family hydrolase [Nitriliruptor sp.]|nr:MAG: HAD family hydrolase [Nitriliruptor sp.]
MSAEDTRTVDDRERDGATAQAGEDDATDWHALETDEVIERLDVDPDAGLTTEEASRRFDEHGPNEIGGDEGTPWWRTLLDQFLNPLIYILIIAAVVTFLLGDYIDTGAIVAVLALNATIGFIQERRAEASVQALMSLVSPTAEVLRDGGEVEIEAYEVVPGDIVLLGSGERIPADLRLLSTTDLQVDESLLTGESTPVGKDPEPVDEDLPLAERSSMAYNGSAVASGRAVAVVVATGERTELGHIAEQMRETEDMRSPLQERMDSFAHIIGAVILVSVVLTVLLGLALGESFAEMLSVAAALAVAAIPEALPVVLTVALALGVRRMADRNAIIRRLAAVETLGSTTLIGSDKTGTLTQNRMSVEQLWTADDRFVFEEEEGLPSDPRDADRREPPSGDADVRTLALLAGVLANEGKYQVSDEGVETKGDPTETAFLVAAARHGFEPDECHEAWEEVSGIPFESERRYAASFRERDGDHHVFVKGAPEKLLEMCERIARVGDDGEVETSELDPEQVQELAEEMATHGLRVLATAYRQLDGPPEDPEDPAEPSGLTLLALHGLLDPPRDGVKEAIERCQGAGQRVIMITGDHANTARAIAHQLGIVQDPDAEVLTGPDVEEMDDEQLREQVSEVAVFARVDPEHKLRIVEAARGGGEVVAVTGDGVNDAPALKRADIGIAMGDSGTDVAREASELVLADDNFVSIASAVEEGRITFDNVRKVTFFLISTGVGTFIVIPVSMLFGWPLIMVPAQLLWANLITKGLQDLSLAFEPGEPDVLERPPQGREEPVITGPLWIRTAITGAWIGAGVLLMFAWALAQDYSLAQERTIALTTLVLFQAFHLFSSRSELRSVFTMNPLENRFLAYAQFGALVVHIGALYWAGTQFVLRVAPVPFEAWWRMLAISATVLAVVEVDKLIRRRMRRRQQPAEAAAATDS